VDVLLNSLSNTLPIDSIGIYLDKKNSYDPMAHSYKLSTLIYLHLGVFSDNDTWSAEINMTLWCLLPIKQKYSVCVHDPVQ
jgi:hypothetical protein